MTASCSAWMVATMSRIPSRRVHRREQGCIPLLATSGAAEDLVGEIDHLPPARVELVAPAHLLRGRGGGDVERAPPAPPIHQQRFVIVLLIEDADPADVEVFAQNSVQPTETQPVVRHVQPSHLFGQREHFGIPFYKYVAILGVGGAAQRRRVPAFHSRTFGVQPCVERGDAIPLGPQFVSVFPSCHMPPFVRVWVRPAIVRHDRGLAASPPVRYRLIMEGKSIPSIFCARHR